MKTPAAPLAKTPRGPYNKIRSTGSGPEGPARRKDEKIPQDPDYFVDRSNTDDDSWRMFRKTL